MSDCPGMFLLLKSETTASKFHCPGCQENEQLRAQLLQAHDDRARDLGLAYEAGDKLREQLDRTEKQVEEQIAGSCELVEENTRLRAQLAQRTTALRGLRYLTQGEGCWCGQRIHTGWCLVARRALADFPDAPKEEP